METKQIIRNGEQIKKTNNQIKEFQQECMELMAKASQIDTALVLNGIVASENILFDEEGKLDPESIERLVDTRIRYEKMKVLTKQLSSILGQISSLSL